MATALEQADDLTMTLTLALALALAITLSLTLTLTLTRTTALEQADEGAPDGAGGVGLSARALSRVLLAYLERDAWEAMRPALQAIATA